MNIPNVPLFIFMPMLTVSILCFIDCIFLQWSVNCCTGGGLVIVVTDLNVTRMSAVIHSDKI